VRGALARKRDNPGREEQTKTVESAVEVLEEVTQNNRKPNDGSGNNKRPRSELSLASAAAARQSTNFELAGCLGARGEYPRRQNLLVPREERDRT
jgi:hypothetical protein